MFKMKLLIYHFIILLLIKTNFCFIPVRLMEKSLSAANVLVNFGKVSETLTHEDIVRRGVIQSAAKYFYDKSNQSKRINLTKLDTGEYYDLKVLYKDYYNVTLCKIMLDDLLLNEIQPNVAIVDFNPETKDLPFAHFDAETFTKSNDRVIEFTNNIYSFLSKKDYATVRRLSGQISHTIQDFYSHTNWVELGNTDINRNIGQPNMNGQSVVTANDNLTCDNSCELVTVNCNSIVNSFLDFIKGLGLKASIINCPLKYYKCSNNVLINNKLVSGYYSNQKLDDGTPYEKPTNLIKCSHGGIMDTSSLKDAIGGINKDSSYYLFSPHANLHLKAADLGIKHTAYLFNQIRTRIGDSEFSNLLQLDEIKNLVNITNGVQQCSSNSNHIYIQFSFVNFISILVFYLLYFY